MTHGNVIEPVYNTLHAAGPMIVTTCIIAPRVTRILIGNFCNFVFTCLSCRLYRVLKRTAWKLDSD